jgi:hypothetical protein
VDTLRAVEVLHEVDPRFVTLIETMFGKAVDPHDAWAWIYGAPIDKAMPDMADMAAPGAKRMRLVPTGAPPKKKPTPPAMVGAPAPMAKAADDDSVDVVWVGEFAKADIERRQAFGWASVVEVNGEPFVDLQGDFMTQEDIEKSAYGFVLDSRVGGDQHQKTSDGPLRAGTMIESFVVTDEKAEKMGLPDDMPRGWWVGFQYEPGPTWDDIRDGRKTGFSVHGRGRRIPVEA